MKSTIEEQLLLQDVVSRYVHLVDHAAWDRLDEVFVPDAVVDFTNFAPYIPVLRGLPAIVEQFRGMKHPIAHHAVNVVVTGSPTEATRELTSKLLIVMEDHKVYVGEYRDVMTETPAGWRVQHRVGTRPFRVGGAPPSPFDNPS
ncbi:nuclear transport factor 2 family protein [Pseudonocardia sp. WMMC193]|uniref:nuclear transport factor 2 family protein n=1 Tax=Pseudonocardia sp. WMMC193 TaxID=2911965 RepID=UPI001F246546|nr:nuclear transport factor 2 family protein [Pseudonocardia sp. WMMC193]MCF7550687.1 nuclear transport factor 2 family protein [Pseudonocardia sp. WMMC193]